MSEEIPIEGHCEARFRGVRERFEANFRGGGEVGAAVCITLDGEPVVDLWGGFVDPERTRPWQRDTIVNTYSTTKGMTAICLNRLVDEGRLDLEAPVASYWPEFAASGKEKIPVRWLLSHRAGLPAVREKLPAEALFDWERMCAALAAEEPWWEPGGKHGYHPVTFGFLVGEVLRRIDGRSLGTYFREEIAEPLGLDFHIGLDPAEQPRCADLIPVPKPEGGAPSPMQAFQKDTTSMTALAFANPPQPRRAVNSAAWRAAEIPSANGHGTARALARAYGALACGGRIDGVDVLSVEAIERARGEEAHGPDAVLLGMPMRFGLGFFLTQRFVPLGPNPTAFGHPGYGGSIAFADPDARVGFGYVMNQMQNGMTGDARGFPLIQAVYDCL